MIAVSHALFSQHCRTESMSTTRAALARLREMSAARASQTCSQSARRREAVKLMLLEYYDALMEGEDSCEKGELGFCTLIIVILKGKMRVILSQFQLSLFVPAKLEFILAFYSTHFSLCRLLSVGLVPPGPAQLRAASLELLAHDGLRIRVRGQRRRLLPRVGLRRRLPRTSAQPRPQVCTGFYMSV